VLGSGVAALGTIRREVHWDDDVADRPCGGREALEHSDP
jgi:hypothetical protein